jgi:hypothetical protein
VTLTGVSTGIERIESIPGISTLTREDVSTFRNIPRSATCYADSWLYLIRATRCDKGDFGYKYFNNGLFVGAGLRNNVIHLVHPLGHVTVSALIDLCHDLHRSTGLTVVLRKIPHDLHCEMIGSGHFCAENRSLSPGVLEDDAFPEHTIDLSLLSRMESLSRTTFSNLARQVRKFDPHAWQLQKPARRVDSALEAKAMLMELSGANREKYLAYSLLVREAFLNLSAYPVLLSRIYKDNHRVHGLYIAEALSDRTAGLYCALSSAAHRGITEWMDVDFFRYVHGLGYKEMLFGGSETSGVDRYVKKFKPTLSVPLMRCLTYKSGFRLPAIEVRESSRGLPA